MFRHTSTIGLRETVCRRHVLSRREEVLPAPDGGTLRLKVAEGHGVRREKVEFDDRARVARAMGAPLGGNHFTALRENMV